MLDDAEDPKLRRPGWGGLARRGAGQLKRSETYRDEDAAVGAERRAARNKRDREAAEAPPRRSDARTERSVREAADAAAARGARRPAKGTASKKPAGKATGRPTGKPAGKAGASGKAGGARKPAARGKRAQPARGGARGARAGRATTIEEAVGDRRVNWARRHFDEAVEAFVEERFTEARRAIRPLAEDAPSVPEVRELHGLILYRMGRWKEARQELAAAYALSSDVAQHPVWMDCERALGNAAEVQRLWTELGRVSPDPATMTEGRIVAAGALADAGDVAAAVGLLGKGFRRSARPAVHTLRRAYALADLLERAGEHIEARGLFTWIVEHDPRFGDAADRAASLA